MSTDINEVNNSGGEQITAGIDIGSNSIRMLIAEIKNRKISRQIATFRDSTRLAAGIRETGKLSQNSIDKSITLLQQYRTLLDTYGIRKVKTVATSAVREASNGAEFISLAKEIGIDIELISGDDEARLIYLGVSSAVDFDEDSILFDIGGGSTEFIEIRNSSVTSVRSYKIGVVKLVDEFMIKDDNAEQIERCKKYINGFIIEKVILPTDIKRLTATAGTSTTIAAIHQSLSDYRAELINNYRLKLSYITVLYDKLISTPIAERSAIVGLEKGREDLIIPGTQILIAVMKRLNIDEVIVADYGIREAAAILAADQK